MAKRESIEGANRRAVFAPSQPVLDELALLRLSRTSRDSYPEVERTDLIQLAHRLYNSRRSRTDFFSDGILGEPAWDMLLALYCSTVGKKRHTMTSLCKSAGVAPTTALRWAQLLVTKGLVIREPDARDRRVCRLALSSETDQLMTEYLSSIFHTLRGE